MNLRQPQCLSTKPGRPKRKSATTSCGDGDCFGDIASGSSLVPRRLDVSGKPGIFPSHTSSDQSCSRFPDFARLDVILQHRVDCVWCSMLCSFISPLVALVLCRNGALFVSFPSIGGSDWWFGGVERLVLVEDVRNHPQTSKTPFQTTKGMMKFGVHLRSWLIPFANLTRPASIRDIFHVPLGVNVRSVW